MMKEVLEHRPMSRRSSTMFNMHSESIVLQELHRRRVNNKRFTFIAATVIFLLITALISLVLFDLYRNNYPMTNQNRTRPSHHFEHLGDIISAQPWQVADNIEISPDFWDPKHEEIRSNFHNKTEPKVESKIAETSNKNSSEKNNHDQTLKSQKEKAEKNIDLALIKNNFWDSENFKGELQTNENKVSDVESNNAEKIMDLTGNEVNRNFWGPDNYWNELPTNLPHISEMDSDEIMETSGSYDNRLGRYLGNHENSRIWNPQNYENALNYWDPQRTENTDGSRWNLRGYRIYPNHRYDISESQQRRNLSPRPFTFSNDIHNYSSLVLPNNIEELPAGFSPPVRFRGVYVEPTTTSTTSAATGGEQSQQYYNNINNFFARQPNRTPDAELAEEASVPEQNLQESSDSFTNAIFSDVPTPPKAWNRKKSKPARKPFTVMLDIYPMEKEQDVTHANLYHHRKIPTGRPKGPIYIPVRPGQNFVQPEEVRYIPEIMVPPKQRRKGGRMLMKLNLFPKGVKRDEERRRSWFSRQGGGNEKERRRFGRQSAKRKSRRNESNLLINGEVQRRNWRTINRRNNEVNPGEEQRSFSGNGNFVANMDDKQGGESFRQSKKLDAKSHQEFKTERSFQGSKDQEQKNDDEQNFRQTNEGTKTEEDDGEILNQSSFPHGTELDIRRKEFGTSSHVLLNDILDVDEQRGTIFRDDEEPGQAFQSNDLEIFNEDSGWDNEINGKNGDSDDGEYEDLDDGENRRIWGMFSRQSDDDYYDDYEEDEVGGSCSGGAAAVVGHNPYGKPITAKWRDQNGDFVHAKYVALKQYGNRRDLSEPR